MSPRRVSVLSLLSLSILCAFACGPQGKLAAATGEGSIAEALAGAPYVYLPGMREYNSARGKGAKAVVGKIGTLPFGHRTRAERNGAYFIPEHGSADALPILVLAHGYKDRGLSMVRMFLDHAKKYKVALVAPDALDELWVVPSAGEYSLDSQHAEDALAWLRDHIDHPSQKLVGTAGYAYGCRMASSLATNFSIYRAGMLMHGRYVEAALGENKIRLRLSGSPKDNMFNFSVMKGQKSSFTAHFTDWPNGGPSLHTYDCSTCLHRPHATELEDAVIWFLQKS